MPPGWAGDVADGSWSWNTSEPNNTRDQSSDQTAVGWGIGDGWGETSAGNTSKLDTQTVAAWGATETKNKSLYKAPAERKASTSSTKSFDPPPISPQEDLPSRRSSIWEFQTSAFKEHQRAVSVTPTELSSIVSGTRNLKFSDPAQALRTTLKALQQAVRRQSEYDRATAELDQWRRTRNSEEFARSTTATRKKLDAERIEIGQRQTDAEKKLKHAIDGLAELPDLSAAQLERIQYAVNEAEMSKFQNELKEWIRQANQHPVMQKKEPEPLHEEAEKEKSVTPEDPFSRDPNEWTLEDTKNALAELENRLGVFSDQVYSEDYTTLRDEAQREIQARGEQLRGSFGTTNAEVLLEHREEEQQRVENAFTDRAEKVTALLRERTRLKGDLAECRTLQETLDATLHELTSLLEQIEQYRSHDEQQIMELMHLIQSELSPTRPPPQIKIIPDELLPSLLPSIIPYLQNDILPIIEMFTSEFLQHDRQIQGAVREMSDFIAGKLDGMKINAQALKNINKNASQER